MASVTVVCDRCGRTVEGWRESEPIGMTAGYYNVETSWTKYANPGEKNVCDQCMWEDPRYQADYHTTGGN